MPPKELCRWSNEECSTAIVLCDGVHSISLGWVTTVKIQPFPWPPQSRQQEASPRQEGKAQLLAAGWNGVANPLIFPALIRS